MTCLCPISVVVPDYLILKVRLEAAAAYTGTTKSKVLRGRNL